MIVIFLLICGHCINHNVSINLLQTIMYRSNSIKNLNFISSLPITSLTLSFFRRTECYLKPIPMRTAGMSTSNKWTKLWWMVSRKWWRRASSISSNRQLLALIIFRSWSPEWSYRHVLKFNQNGQLGIERRYIVLLNIVDYWKYKLTKYILFRNFYKQMWNIRLLMLILLTSDSKSFKSFLSELSLSFFP